MLQREQKFLMHELPGHGEREQGCPLDHWFSAPTAQRLPRELFKTQQLGSTPRRS